MGTEGKDLSVATLSRALDMLSYIYDQGKPIRISEMARNMGMSKSTVYRALYTMEQKEFIRKNEENDTYWFGMKLLAIGACIQEKMTISELAHPYVKKLHDEFHEVVNLSILETRETQRPQIVVVHKEESSSHVLKANPAVGVFSDCHSSAAGKCLLAFSDECEIDKRKPFELKKYTEHTITDWETFVRVLYKVREQGYALDQEEREYGLTCIGAPIFDRQGHVTAAVSIAGPSRRMERNLEYKIERVKETAEEISRQYL